MNNAKRNLGYNVSADSFAAFEGRGDLVGINVHVGSRAEAERVRAELVAQHGYRWTITECTVPAGIGPDDSWYGFGGGLA